MGKLSYALKRARKMDYRATFSAADIKASDFCFSDPAVQRIYRNLKFICCIYRTYLFCKLYRLHLVLIFILFIF